MFYRRFLFTVDSYKEESHMPELLFIEPVFRKMIWGGDKLHGIYGEKCPADHIRECWNISAHENGMGRIASGIYKGKTLAQMWEEHPELFGNEDGCMGREFPLLTKLIDAADDLSIQVHPDDDYARSHADGSLGKKECWYVLDCDEDASIIIGHNAKDSEQVREMIQEKRWSEFLREIPIRKGDFFQIDPGCVHAIKGGTFILETQQSSDITYRVYDYERLQNGRPRALHLKESMDVINAPFVPQQEQRRRMETDNVDIEHLVKCDKYSVEKYDIHGKWKHNFRTAFANLTVTEGIGVIDGHEVKPGISLIVPGGYGTVCMEGDFSIICSWPEYAKTEGESYISEQEYEIIVIDWMGRRKAAVSGKNQAVLAFKDIYEEGDRIVFRVPEENRFYKIRVDDTMDESIVFLTRKSVMYDIPFAEKKKSYNKKSFTGERHYLTVKNAEIYETNGYRNLAINVMDQHGERGCYPHASANVETRGESVFAARNAIDGVLANDSHGSWPYESWGINKNDQAEMLLEFGRKVDFNKIVLYTRADFPHDNWWKQATFTFSDGTRETVAMEKSSEPHVFEIERKAVTWLKLSDLIKADDPSPFPALTQIEVYGTESVEQGGVASGC